MAKVSHFNKGTARGKVVKSDVIKYKGKNGKPDGEFLAMDIDCGKGNRVKNIVSPTKSNPNKHTDIQTSYPVGSMVEARGSVQEREFRPDSGGVKVDRSIQAFSVEALDKETKSSAKFLIAGTVELIKPISNGAIVKVAYVEKYKNAEGKEITKDPVVFTLQGNDTIVDLIDDLDLEKGSFAKFKGDILNTVEFDEYGDIVGDVQMFSIEKIEAVVHAGDIEEEEEEMPFDI